MDKDKLTELEYVALRQEIISWQERRFAVLAGTLVIVTAIIGWVINTKENWSWELAASLPLALIASSCYLSWLFARFTVMIGSYFEVFYESNWERRHRKFASRLKFQRLNVALAMLYSGLSSVVVLVLLNVCAAPPTGGGFALFSGAIILVVAAAANLGFNSYPREDYISRWKGIGSDEASKVNVAVDSTGKANTGST